jgi:mevalonate kinase
MSQHTTSTGIKTYYANGKLLLTGEYIVLDGALAVALPTKFGQFLTIEPINEPILDWTSLDTNKKPWFHYKFEQLDKAIEENKVAERLRLILLQAQKQNPQFLTTLGYKVQTRLTFPRTWGLGSSSTLIYLLSEWANCNPFTLLFEAFGGSGYDIACAGNDFPIYYQLKGKNNPIFQINNFNPPFKDQLYFIYLGKKQDSKEGIADYKKKGKKNTSIIEEISVISQKIVSTKDFNEFEHLLTTHEYLIADLLGYKKVKDLYFETYWGSIKSLGAWGGDFILATSNRSYKETKEYFNEKGFNVFLRYKELILESLKK